MNLWPLEPSHFVLLVPRNNVGFIKEERDGEKGREAKERKERGEKQRRRTDRKGDGRELSAFSSEGHLPLLSSLRCLGIIFKDCIPLLDSKLRFKLIIIFFQFTRHQ